MARNGHNVVTVFLKQRLLASRISNRKNVNIDEEANLWNIWSCLIIVFFISIVITTVMSMYFISNILILIECYN